MKYVFHKRISIIDREYVTAMEMLINDLLPNVFISDLNFFLFLDAQTI